MGTRLLQVLFVSSVASVGFMPMWIRQEPEPQETFHVAGHGAPVVTDGRDAALAVAGTLLQWIDCDVQWPPLVQPIAVSLHPTQGLLHLVGGSMLHNFGRLNWTTDSHGPESAFLLP